MSTCKSSPDNLLTENEIATRLKVRRETLSLYRRAGSNPLPCFKLGAGRSAHVRYDWFEVVVWMKLNGHAVPGTERSRGTGGGAKR